MDAPRLPFSPRICTLIRLIWRINVTYLVLWAALAAAGQEPSAIVRVASNPPGLPFRVDGLNFSGAASFAWPAGSKHVLSADPMLDGVRAGARYRFAGWRAGDTQLQQAANTIIVSADAAITEYRAEYGAEYLMSLSFFNCGEDRKSVV